MSAAEEEKGARQVQTARLFFALWPDVPVRKTLHAMALSLQSACGGRAARADTLHLTLVFLGDVALERIDALRKIGSAISARSFMLDVDRCAWWRHNRLAWAAPTETPAELARLVEDLQQGLEREGFVFDKRAYVPHITLVRRASCREIAPLPALRWLARDFVLVRSVVGAKGAAYELVGRWPLIGK